MSEFKGTPGPWIIENTTDIFGPMGGDSGDGVKCDSNDAWQIADVGFYASFVDGELIDMGNEPRKANAQLIAAAPELLEALLAAMAYIKATPCDPDITSEQTRAWMRLQDINPDAAIAKALGTTER